MTDYLSVQLEGDRTLELGLTLIQAKARERLRGIVGGWSHYTLYWLRLYVPVDSGYTLRHTDASTPTWRPGGPGGGGEWVSTVGIKTGTSRHPLYRAFGTGLYAGRGLIRPHHPGGFTLVSRNPRRGVLTFQKRGEQRRFRYWVRGQRGRNFLYAAYQQARIYANARVHTLGREILS